MSIIHQSTVDRKKQFGEKLALKLDEVDEARQQLLFVGAQSVRKQRVRRQLGSIYQLFGGSWGYREYSCGVVQRKDHRAAG